MKKIEDIVAEAKARQDVAGPLLAQMREVRNIYNGDMVLPIAETGPTHAAIPNLLQQGLDQLGARIASTPPDLYYPPNVPGQRQSERRANLRRKATLGWWQDNRMQMKLRRRARHLVGYACSPVVIRPDSTRQSVLWEVRDPMGCFPALTGDPDELTPPNAIFSYIRSLSWLQRAYPDAMRGLYKGDDPKGDDQYDLLEWHDEYETVLVAVGKHKPYWMSENDAAQVGAGAVELERYPNLTGMCPVVIPGRITLDRPQGQFHGMIGMYQTNAMLMALQVMATQKSIFPDLAIESRPNESGDLDGGVWHDGRTGLINIIKGGTLKEVQLSAGFQTIPVMNQIERAQRLTAGIPAEFGGESPTNVRTGKRGDAVMGALVDFPVQEAQEVLAASMQEENKRAIATTKAFWGGKTKTIYVQWKGSSGTVEYVPDEIFENDNNIVTFPHAGADANALVVSGGQRVGQGTLSKRSFMELDPMVSDPEMEHDRIIAEGLEQAFLSSIQTAAAQPDGMPLPDLARLAELVLQDKKELYAAMQQVHDEAQKRQATDVNPVAPGAPEAQPGITAPGSGAEAGVAIPEVAPSLDHLDQLAARLRGPGRSLPPSMRPAA